MRPKFIHGGYNCDVSIEPLKSETYTKGVTIRRDEYFLEKITQMILTHGVMRRFKFTVPWNIIKSKRVKVTVYYA